MRASPSIRRAAQLAAAGAVMLWTAASNAQTLLRFPNVPDANPPTTSTLGVPCIQDFSAPTAAANLLGFLDNLDHGPYGHWNAGGVTGGPLGALPGPVVAEHLSWFMATNSRRNSACASGAVDTWGRTNARAGATPGTRIGDLVPGLVEYFRWDDALHPFPGPAPRPALPSGKRAYDWRFRTFLNPHDPSDQNFVDAYTFDVYFQPLIMTFRHWHLSFLCTEGGIEYYDWLPSVSGTDDPAFAPSYSGGGTPPAEHWNDDNLGHAAIGIGYYWQHQPPCTGAARSWFIVRDGIPNTGATVAVPFYYDENAELSWMTSFTMARDIAITPDLAVDASGNRHVVWAGSPLLSPGPSLYYAGNAAPGGSLTGTEIGWGTDPAIAVDPSTGSVTVAFVQGIAIHSRTNSLGYWDEQTVANTGPVPRTPAIAIDSASNAHVVWQVGCYESIQCQGGPPGYLDVRLYWSDRPAGGGWSAPQAVFDLDDPESTPDQVTPNLSADLALHGTHAYLVYDHEHGEIRLLEGSISGGVITWDKSSVQTVSTATGHAMRVPKVAVDDDGDVYVVWSDQRSGIWQTYHQARRAGSWLAADLALSSATTSATEPDLTVRNTPSGTYVDVAWEQELPAGNYEIVSTSLFAGANGGVSYPGAIANRSVSAAPSRSPAIAYNAALNKIDLAWADDAVTLLPEAGLGGLLAAIAALAGLRRTAARSPRCARSSRPTT